MNEQIKNYINENLSKGLSIDEIKRNLSYTGKTDEQIKEIFTQYQITISRPNSETQVNQTANEKPIDEAVKPTNSEKPGPRSRSGAAIKMFSALVLVGILIGVIFKIKFQKPSGVERSISVSKEIHEKYLSIWKEMFMLQNDIDEYFFTEHIYPQKTSLNKENEIGEEFIVDYEYKVDWATIYNRSSIIIKLKEGVDYLSFDDIRDGVTGNVVKTSDPEKPHYIQYDPVLIVKNIISKDSAEEKLVECRQGMKPASKTFKISAFTREGESQLRLLYRAVKVLNSNQVVMAEVDLETGEMNCYEADLKFN